MYCISVQLLARKCMRNKLPWRFATGSDCLHMPIWLASVVSQQGKLLAAIYCLTCCSHPILAPTPCRLLLALLEES